MAYTCYAKDVRYLRCQTSLDFSAMAIRKLSYF